MKTGRRSFFWYAGSLNELQYKSDLNAGYVEE